MVINGNFLNFSFSWRKSWNETYAKQFGPALKLPWTKLKAPTLSNKLIDRLVEGTKKQSKGKSVTKISNIRDEYLVELQKLRKKYEKKLR
jgi:carnitine 3-dehydrogenase